MMDIDGVIEAGVGKLWEFSGGVSADFVLAPIKAAFHGIIAVIAEFLSESIIFWMESYASAFLTEGSLITEGWDSVAVDIRTRLWYISAVMVAVGVVWQSLRIIWNKNGEPLAQLIKSTAIFIFVAGSGLGLVQAGSFAADELTRSFLQADGFSVIDTFENVGFASPARLFVLLFGMVPFALVMGYIWVVTWAKDILVVVASGALVLAASGQFFGFSREWLNKLVGTLVATLLYKPGIAFVLSLGLEIIRSGGVIGLILGPLITIAGVWAAKPLLKVFTSINYAGSIGSGQSFGTGAIGSRSTGYSAAMPTGIDR